jgi:hypothetical protein
MSPITPLTNAGEVHNGLKFAKMLLIGVKITCRRHDAMARNGQQNCEFL